MLEVDNVDVSLAHVTIGYGETPDVVHNVSLTVPACSTTVLLGPSGCGKTTLLRAIAGLERPRSGAIWLRQQVVSDESTWVPPERRNLGMVFQDPALFPHLTVRDNIGFGLRSLERSARVTRVDEMLDLVELNDVADRRPGSLSGGQQQRVALARSLAPRPGVLLLDEPFSALDASLRVQLRTEVATILAEIGVTAVFVTLDQDEAFALGDAVAVMRGGVIEQVGRPEDLYRSPTNPWVARFVGEANLVRGVADGTTALTSVGPIALRSPTAGNVDLLVRPESLSIVGPGTHGVVARVEYFGHDVRYEVVASDGAMLVVRHQGDHRASVGDRVELAHRGDTSLAWTAAD